jgi:hypothetical protein
VSPSIFFGPEDRGHIFLWLLSSLPSIAIQKTLKLNLSVISVFTVSVVRKLRVKLKYPNVALDEFGNRGQWTMIYNEGFEVTVNQRTFFAYSYFTRVMKMLLWSALSSWMLCLVLQNLPGVSEAHTHSIIMG